MRAVFSDETPYSLLDVYQRFVETCYTDYDCSDFLSLYNNSVIMLLNIMVTQCADRTLHPLVTGNAY
jgi:hypothetical protein